MIGGRECGRESRLSAETRSESGGPRGRRAVGAGRDRPALAPPFLPLATTVLLFIVLLYSCLRLTYRQGFFRQMIPDPY